MYDLNLDILAASSRHHPNGQPKDTHGYHRRAHLSALRAKRSEIWIGLFRQLLGGLGLYSTSTVAQVSKQTPFASAITPIVARPPSPRSGPKTSTSRSDSPDETLCTSS
mgnify:CR=1 FL=1